MSDAPHPLILFYTPHFRSDPAAWPQCAAPLRCTSDRARLPEADVVVFHVPDIRLRGIGGARKYPGQRWVAWSAGSRINFPRLADPGFRRHFDLFMTYEREADVWTSYLPAADDWQAALAQPVPPKTEPAPVVLFQSARNDRCGRNDYSAELMRHIAVDSYGRFRNNRAMPGDDQGSESKRQRIGAYHFCLAFENSRAPDYVTEKIYDALRAGSVPVYRGAPNVGEFAPPGSFINADDFESPRALAAHLHRLVQNPGEYARYLEWRRSPLPDLLRRGGELQAVPPIVRLDRLVSALPPLPRTGRPKLPFGIPAYLAATLYQSTKRGRRPA